MFKNEKVDKINEQMKKLEDKKTEIEKAISDMETALDQTVELYALGEITDKDVEEAHDFLKARRAELLDVERMIQRVASVRRKAAIESLPFVKDAKAKKLEKIQSEYDKKVESVFTARNEFLKELAELGQIKSKVNSVNNEFNDIMTELGETPSIYGGVINERKLYSPEGFTNEADCLGIKEERQKRAYSGELPNWVGEAK